MTIIRHLLLAANILRRIIIFSRSSARLMKRTDVIEFESGSDLVKDWTISTRCFPGSLVHDWLVQCQFKVTGWDIVFICGMVLRCAGTHNSAWVFTSYSRSDNYCHNDTVTFCKIWTLIRIVHTINKLLT